MDLGTPVKRKPPKRSTAKQRSRIDVLCRQNRISYPRLLEYIKDAFPNSYIRTLQDLTFTQAYTVLSVLSLPYEQMVQRILQTGEHK